PRQDFDQKKSGLDAQRAAVREAETRLTGARSTRQETAARLAGAQKRIAQNQAMLTRVNDVLEKHYSIAPLDGMVTNHPVRVGERYFEPGGQGVQSGGCARQSAGRDPARAVLHC